MSAPAPGSGLPRLVDLLLEEQQQTLRAVDEFSRRHEVDAFDADRYRSLIPTGLPGVGQQFAFVVDLDSCTGCKACVTACHSLNGLEPGETWRRVGMVEGGDSRCLDLPYQQTVTTACHHCESPACLSGCPVRAYEKDEVTGIVRHLDDQCIGCRYCQMMCPYDVPQFSERLGIVRKCDMCHGRLEAGEAPACVQGCPNGAISIEVVDRGAAVPEMLLPLVKGEMPDSQRTRPSTRYSTRRQTPGNLHASDRWPLEASEGHAPMVSMLVFTQAAVGAVLFEASLSWGRESDAVERESLVVLGLTTLLGLTGLASSFRHLGRPQWAFRAFLGLKTSWMSREILVFGLFAPALIASTFLTGAVSLRIGGGGASFGMLSAARDAALVVAAASGLLGVFCSVRIYAATGRPLWRSWRSALRFGGTVLGLGTALTAFAWALGRAGGEAGGLDRAAILWPGLTGALLLSKLWLEETVLLRPRWRVEAEDGALRRSRALLEGVLASPLRTRRLLGLVGTGLLPALQIALALLAMDPAWIAVVAGLVLSAAIGGELMERSLFFRSEAMRAMPGLG